MGWIECVRCPKFLYEFVVRTFALIAPVQPISHRVSCSNETIQNAPKHYKTHQFMSLASNGVDRVCSLRKTLMPFRGMNFFINCTSSTILHRVPCSNEILPNALKHYEMLQNMSLVPMGWIACVRCKKIRCEFVARTFALIAPVQPISRRVSCSNETIQNAPKHYKPHQFMSLASNGVDQVRSLRKTLMRFRGTNFFINCTNSTRFAPSFVQ